MSEVTKYKGYRRRYWRRYWRRNRQIANQYFRAKIDYVDEIVWPSGQAGEPRFRDSETNTLSCSAIYNKDEYKSYRKLFGYQKIYAYSISVKPITMSSLANTPDGTIVVGFNPDSDNGYDFASGSVSNYSAIVSSVQNTRIFRKLDNSIGYLSTFGAMRGSFYVVSNFQTEQSVAQRYSICISLYVMFKTTKI